MNIGEIVKINNYDLNKNYYGMVTKSPDPDIETPPAVFLEMVWERKKEFLRELNAFTQFSKKTQHTLLSLNRKNVEIIKIKSLDTL